MTRWIDSEDVPEWLVAFRQTLAAIERETLLRKYQRDSWIVAEGRRIEQERARMAEGGGQ
jgi:hypothetical protein